MPAQNPYQVIPIRRSRTISHNFSSPSSKPFFARVITLRIIPNQNLNHKYELTFLVSHVPGEKKILIEGMLPEPQELGSIMFQGMAEMYAPKFSAFLERKDLISLTLKAAMTWTEFNNFIPRAQRPHQSYPKGRYDLD
jgi:hypothetical protein